jgi:hypothetical protein
MSAHSANSAIQNQQLTQNQRQFELCPDTKPKNNSLTSLWDSTLALSQKFVAR